jgi:hypothetical protein
MSRPVTPIFMLLFALGLLSAFRAEAQDAPLCAFAKRVLAERTSEFIKLKGAPPPNETSRTTFGIVEAKELYARNATELRSCFSGATISESFPKATDSTLTWKWKAQTVEYSAELEVSNGIYLMQNLLAGKPATDHLKMSVGLSIRDLSPPPPGATIPELR